MQPSAPRPRLRPPRASAPPSSPSKNLPLPPSSSLGSLTKTAPVRDGRVTYDLPQGAVVIASITSCTNTSNPSVMLGAGLLAKKAVERGLSVKPWVKTSLAPGSKVVTDYLRDAGLMPYLEAARLPPRRLRLHDVHRQLGPAAGRRLRRRAHGRHGRRGRPLGQPQLRGPHQPAGQDELPRVAPARRRVRARGRDGQGPHDRADRHGPRRRARLPEGHLADAGRGPRGDPDGREARALPEGVRRRLRRRREAGRP